MAALGAWSQRVCVLLCVVFCSVGSALSRDRNVYRDGGIVQTDPGKKRITLVFTAADRCDGAKPILQTLAHRRVPGAFFLTGHFFRLYPDVVQQLVDAGHYVGSHSYAHLLYFPWGEPDNMSVSQEEFQRDMLQSYEQLAQYGITPKSNPYFIPPYEHYNQQVSDWAREMGLQVVNYTPGTASAADYTTPDMPNYRSSDSIYTTIMDYERQHGLNGFLLIFHMGTSDARTDKFYATHLDRLICELRRLGYEFVPLKKAIGKRKTN